MAKTTVAKMVDEGYSQSYESAPSRPLFTGLKTNADERRKFMDEYDAAVYETHVRLRKEFYLREDGRTR